MVIQVPALAGRAVISGRNTLLPGQLWSRKKQGARGSLCPGLVSGWYIKMQPKQLIQSTAVVDRM